jgi:hypothetical protein
MIDAFVLVLMVSAFDLSLYSPSVQVGRPRSGFFSFYPGRSV